MVISLVGAPGKFVSLTQAQVFGRLARAWTLIILHAVLFGWLKSEHLFMSS